MSNKVLVINDENFKSIINESKKPIVIDVFAPWCGPCVTVGPIFEEIAEELGEQYDFFKINIDDSLEAAKTFFITSIPSFIFIKNGSPIAKEVGLLSKQDLTAKIKKHLS